MIRAITLLVVLAFAAAALIASEHSRPNDGLPLVKTAWEPAWRLYTTCPIDRRNIPIVDEERTA